MLLLESRPLIESMEIRLAAGASDFRKTRGYAPKLVVILVGSDPASAIYTRRKGEAAQRLGFEHETVQLPATTSSEEVKGLVQKLNRDPRVHGVLLQRPLPAGFREEEVVYWISPAKDVDAFHPENTGRLHLGLPCLQPCTPSGIMQLLAHYSLDPAGKVACVVGRSSIVGKPLSALLLQAHATVLHAHSRTPDLAHWTRQADYLFVAVGKSGFIGREHVKAGAVVVDVGINRVQGRVVGDVKAAEMRDHASAYTPVPGGVGPMTIAVLLQNTLKAALSP